MFREGTMKRLLKRGFSPMKVTTIKWSIIDYLVRRRNYGDAYKIMVNYRSCSLCVVAGSCYWCPLYTMTGKPHCENTPYKRIFDLLTRLVCSRLTIKERQQTEISLRNRMREMLFVFWNLNRYLITAVGYNHFRKSVYYKGGKYYEFEVS